MIEVQQKAAAPKQRGPRKTPKRETADQQEEPAVEFTKNPNLGNVIKKLEERQNHMRASMPQDETAPLVEETRTKKYKKPLDTLAARQERIKMVKGLQQPIEGSLENMASKAGEEKKVQLPQPEELESTLTHKEIEELSQKFGLTWQQIF